MSTEVLVHLPASYDTSGNAYPVLYLLDGTPALLLEMIAITTRLRNDRNAPEMIVVAIENTNRNRDMMPVVAKDYPGPPRAEAFLGFLEFAENSGYFSKLSTRAFRTVESFAHSEKVRREEEDVACMTSLNAPSRVGEHYSLSGPCDRRAV